MPRKIASNKGAPYRNSLSIPKSYRNNLIKIGNVSEYEQEVQERWGQTEAYQQSTSRTSKYKHADFAAAKFDQEAVTERFANAFGNGVDFKSAEVQEIVLAHREAISKWFYECSVEMQRNLALMYIGDERFKKYYDGRVRGLAQYVHDAIRA
jgi:hypothetical protein